MRVAFPTFQFCSTTVEKLRLHRVECVLVGGMVTSLCLVTGVACGVLFNPNLGESIRPVSLLKPGSVPEGGISAMGDALLELSKPLRIEVIAGEGPSQPATAVTIVSPAEFQPQLVAAAQTQGVRLLWMTLAAGGALVTMVRLGPALPLGPKRRQPLGERLASVSLPDHPLSIKHTLAPPVEPQPKPRTRRVVPVTALGELPARRESGLSVSGSRVITGVTTVVMTANVSGPEPTYRYSVAPAKPSSLGSAPPEGATTQSSPQPSQPRILRVQPQPQPQPQPRPQPRPQSRPDRSNTPDWLKNLDLRQQTPINSLL